MSIEAMKLALDEFENQKAGLEEVGVTDHNLDELITALRQAIEQAQKQEPIGEVVTAGVIRWKDKYPSLGTKLYTSPPQRQSVGLTDEEKYKLADDVARRGIPIFEAIRQAEAKLKEKNT